MDTFRLPWEHGSRTLQAFVRIGGGLTLLGITRARLPELHLTAAIRFCGSRSAVGMKLGRNRPLLAGALSYLMDELDGGKVRSRENAAAVREAALYLRTREDKAMTLWLRG